VCCSTYCNKNNFLLVQSPRSDPRSFYPTLWLLYFIKVVREEFFFTTIQNLPSSKWSLNNLYTFIDCIVEVYFKHEFAARRQLLRHDILSNFAVRLYISLHVTRHSSFSVIYYRNGYTIALYPAPCFGPAPHVSRLMHIVCDSPCYGMSRYEYP